MRCTSRLYFARYFSPTDLCLLDSTLNHSFHDQVDDRMAEKQSTRGGKQVPERKIRAFKKLYLNPGLPCQAPAENMEVYVDGPL
jgi:hypothetical protein